MDFLKNYNVIRWVEFSNLNFNFDTNYFNEVTFNYNNINYVWKVIGGLKENNLKLYEAGKMNITATPNTLLKHKDFDFFLFNNSKNKDLQVNKENLFSELKLGILGYA